MELLSFNDNDNTSCFTKSFLLDFFLISRVSIKCNYTL